MPKPISWASRLHYIREVVQNSVAESWTRTDLERAFEIERSSAQTLMKAIGDVNNFGGKHFVERASVLEFLDEMIQTEDIAEAFAGRLAGAKRPPKPRKIKIPIPQDIRSICGSELPSQIRLSPLKIEITGEDFVEILQHLYTLSQALQNDPESLRLMIEPPAKPPRRAGDDELARFLHRIRDDRAAQQAVAATK